ncbi:MAG: DUF6326 family protein [Parvibaculaceae bacterium]
MDKVDTKTKLSALWLFMLLNIIFRDIHQLAMKSYLEMLLSGASKSGTPITDDLMLIVGFVIEIPIAMVLFSLLLTRRILRPVTFVAVIITAVGLVSSAPSDKDDIFFLVIELAVIAGIVWTVWTWRGPAASDSGGLRGER